MATRGQTDTRITVVEKSLDGLSKAIVPRVNVDLPADAGSEKKKGTVRKL
jgi:hypothetical protein